MNDDSDGGKQFQNDFHQQPTALQQLAAVAERKAQEEEQMEVNAMLVITVTHTLCYHHCHENHQNHFSCSGANGFGRKQPSRDTNPGFTLVNSSASLPQVELSLDRHHYESEPRELPSSTTTLPLDHRDLSRPLDNHRDCRDGSTPRIAPASLLPSALYKPSVRSSLRLELSS